MENKSGFTPNGDLVLILPIQVATKTAGGIELPEMVRAKEAKAVRIGTVLAMGEDAALDPRMKDIEVGAQVLFPRYTGDPFPVDDIEYLIVRAASIFGPVTKLPSYTLGAVRSNLEEFGANQPA